MLAYANNRFKIVSNLRAFVESRSICKVAQIGGAFGVLWLDTALVVLFAAQKLIWTDPRSLFVAPILKLRRDYQSCVEPQHSKASHLQGIFNR
jgi:hypothetical protein